MIGDRHNYTMYNYTMFNYVAISSMHRPHRRPSYLSQASCVIVSGFTAALDLDTYPLRNLICPRCAERAKPGQGKPVLIMQLAFRLFSRHISRTQSFQQNRYIFHALVALKLLESLISRPVACSPRIVAHKQMQTHRPSTVKSSSIQPSVSTNTQIHN